MRVRCIKFTTTYLAILFLVININAQTTSFSYQGRLTDAGSPANGSFQMQFKLFDAASGGAQIGTTLTDVPVTVTAGSFSVKLDFGASAFPGANRFIEIAVRHNSGESYVPLTPREQIVSSPYAVRTLGTAMADDSQKLGGVNANQYVTTSTVGNAFVNNATVPQTANFNITGNGFIGGSVGIGTAVPNAKLEVRGAGVQQRITETTTGNSLVLQSGAGSNMKVTGFNYNTFTGVPLYLSVDGGNTILNSGGGNVGVGLTSPATKLSVFSNFYGIAHTDGTVNLSTFLNSAGGWIGTTSNHSLNFFTNDGGQSMTVTPAGNVGIGTINPTQKLHVAGTIRTSVLQVTAGSDLAENFETEATVKPGMVVAIDPLNTGKLVLARGAYNRRVAGIVSGANNLSAGMLLPDLKESTDSMPVALSGRVWVYADAGKDPIRPGDLLTTSSVAGHAMKVRDHRRAQGAIIGKAMSELKAGTGLVLVLVSLQ